MRDESEKMSQMNVAKSGKIAETSNHHDPSYAGGGAVLSSSKFSSLCTCARRTSTSAAEIVYSGSGRVTGADIMGADIMGACAPGGRRAVREATGGVEAGDGVPADRTSLYGDSAGAGAAAGSLGAANANRLLSLIPVLG